MFLEKAAKDKQITHITILDAKRDKITEAILR